MLASRRLLGDAGKVGGDGVSDAGQWRLPVPLARPAQGQQVEFRYEIPAAYKFGAQAPMTDLVLESVFGDAAVGEKPLRGFT
jgi:hypothetical protein